MAKKRYTKHRVVYLHNGKPYNRKINKVLETIKNHASNIDSDLQEGIDYHTCVLVSLGSKDGADVCTVNYMTNNKIPISYLPELAKSIAERHLTLKSLDNNLNTPEEELGE